MRIVTKNRLGRRTFLKAAGVAVALPLLDAMTPALTAAARPSRVASFAGLSVS